MDAAVLGGIIRAIIAAVGGGFLAQGYVDESTLNIIIGALASLASAAWSVWVKVREKKA